MHGLMVYSVGSMMLKKLAHSQLVLTCICKFEVCCFSGLHKYYVGALGRPISNMEDEHHLLKEV